MRIIPLLIVLLTAFNTYAQTDTAISFIEVVQVEGATQEQLFQRGRVWFADMFKDSKSVIQISDKETGELFGKGILMGEYKYQMLGGQHYQKAAYSFTFRVIVKEGCYKYLLTDLEHIGDYDSKGLL
jgi:hypothetical protein